MSGQCRATFLVLTLATEISCASAAAAINFFELEAYSAGTRGQGAMYVESFNTVVPRGSRASEEETFPSDDMVRSSLEVNYGLGERLDLALYLDTAKPEGGNLRYAGVRLRARGPIAQETAPFDLGWYAELEFPQRRFAEEDAALEVRAIVSRDWRGFSIRFNPILEQPFNGDEAGQGPDLQYAARAGYAISEFLSIRVEGFGEFGPLGHIPAAARQQHYILPLCELEPFHGFEVAAGPGFGLTRTSDDLFVKLVLEYKFYAGAP
jgi:hypothetical protein